MDFNKEQINLCMRIAVWYKKKIESGDYWMGMDSHPVLSNGNIGLKSAIPLWQIHDCFNFFRKRGYRVKLDEDAVGDRPFTMSCYGHKTDKAFRICGATDLAACLNAVLLLVEGK